MVAYAGSKGKVLNLEVDVAYSKGDFMARGGLVGLCLDNVAAGGQLALQTNGLFKGVPFVGTGNVDVGDKLYAADNGNSVNKVSTGGRVAVGYAASVKTTTDDGEVVDVLLTVGVV